LRADGHTVVARNREPQHDGSDDVLSSLAESDFDQLWLIAVDRGNGLAPSDVRGILRFRERGSGVLTARVHQNLGASLLNLGAVGIVNNFSTYNRQADHQRLRRDDREPLRFSNNRKYQHIIALEPVHEILLSRKSPTGVIDYFPALNDGTISVPSGFPYARVIAKATSTPSGRCANAVIVIDGEPGVDGQAPGRAVAVSTFQHFEDVNWKLEAEHQPFALEIYKDYICNIARWLAPQNATATTGIAAAHIHY
jgi:hypothetical protein